MKKSIYIILSGFIFSLFVLSGCGYTARSLIKDKYSTIYITPFVNKIDITRDSQSGSNYKIYKPMIETDITRAVIQRFLLDGNLKPASFEDADLVLKGELAEFRRDALRYTRDDQIEEYRLNMIVNISLWNRAEKKMIWEEKNYTGTSTYFTLGSAAVQESAAINEAVKDLSRSIVDRVVDQW